MDSARIVDELDRLLAEMDRARTASPHGDLSGGLGDEELRMISTRFLSAIERNSAPGSSYRAEAAATGGWEGKRLLALGGVLLALRHDIADGYLRTIAEVLRADIFADFLEMATELLDKEYKDPAAVMAGSVLEEHLRKLAEKAGITSASPDGRPIKADRINAELARTEVYNKLEQKSVTAWLDLRNRAAHGAYEPYEDYDKRQVETLITSVRDFLVRHPA